MGRSSRRGVIAVALVAAAAIALPASAGAGQPDVSLKVAKQKDGPYREHVGAHMDLNQAKDFYWKVRNVTDAKLTQVLIIDGAKYPPGWIARWFRGENNITSDVRNAGYEFALGVGKSKIFRSHLKATKAIGPLCHDAAAGPPETSQSFALVSINDPVCLF